MQEKFNNKEKRQVRECFVSNDLYMVCHEAFLSRAGRLDGAKVDAEDIFYEVAKMLDSLEGYPKFPSDQKDMRRYLSNLVLKYREWQGSTVRDREMIADTVFRIVRILMCHRWQLCYSEDLYEAMGEVLKSKSIQEDGEDVNNLLLGHCDELSKWINEEYNGHLCDEIERAVRGETEKQKPRSGRKPIDPNTVTASFTYMPNVDYRNNRLQAFYDCLHRVFIHADTDLQLFVNIFSGNTTTETIVWIRHIRELHYLFDKLEKLGLITHPSSYGKWQMVCARFKCLTKRGTSVDDGMTDDSYVIEPLTPDQFSKDSGTPDSHDELDKIIKILTPRINIRESLQEFIDYCDEQGEHDDIKDYRDALANDLQIVSRL